MIYLGLTGRLRLDWGWLLGIGVLKPFQVADQMGLPFREHVNDLQERLIALGHAHSREDWRLPWALIRLVLHRGDPDISAITADDIEEMRQAIRHLQRVPVIDQVIAPHQLPTVQAAWGTNAYRAGLALFHTGVIRHPPHGCPPLRGCC